MSLLIGKVHQSRKINDAVVKNVQFSTELAVALRRYMAHDWGDSSVDRKVANDMALFDEETPISSSYATCMGLIHITTDRKEHKTSIVFTTECMSS